MLIFIPKARPSRQIVPATALLTVILFFSCYLYVSPPRVIRTFRNNAPVGKRKFELFLNKLFDAPPANTTVYDEEGLAIVRIEDVNQDTQRRDVATISDEDFNFSQASHKAVVKMLPEFQDAIQYASGTRGIVTVGGGNYTTSILVTLRMLRKRQCNLPMEVFIPSNEPYDTFFCDRAMAELNAKCIHLPTFDNIHISAFQFKIIALIFSSFENALFLDSDNIPIIDPTELFSSKAYRSTGYVTWPDFWGSTASPIFYRLIGKDIPSLLAHASTESGEILINRRKHARTLLLNAYYNIFGPHFYFPLLAQGSPGGGGDKETWVAAAQALDAPYYQVREMNKVITKGDYLNMGDDIAMVQYDLNTDYAAERRSHATYRDTPDAKAIFVHHSRIKLNPWYLQAEIEEKMNGTRRMWGDKQKTIDRFGSDLEAEMWDEILLVACRYARDDTEKEACVKLRKFWYTIVCEEELSMKLEKAQNEIQPLSPI
jgi:alpha 1,2-mannosyltransferase